MTCEVPRLLNGQAWIQAQGCLTSPLTLYHGHGRLQYDQGAAGSKNSVSGPKAKGAWRGHLAHVTGIPVRLHWEFCSMRSEQLPRARPQHPWAPVNQAGHLMGSPLAPKHPVLPSRGHRTCSGA